MSEAGLAAKQAGVGVAGLPAAGLLSISFRRDSRRLSSPQTWGGVRHSVVHMCSDFTCTDVPPPT